MTRPTTLFERTGEWTPLDEEATLLQQIAADSDAVLTVMGESVMGQPIWRVDLGTPGKPVIVVVSLHHGNEPAPREAVLSTLLDITYTTGHILPDGYLDRVHLIVIPTLNPSALPGSRVGEPAGLDPNREHISLGRLESVAIAKLMAAESPEVVIDLHEFMMPGDVIGDDYLTTPKSSLVTEPMRAIRDSALDAIVDHVRGDGFTTAEYATSAPGTLRSTTPAWHALGLLSETNMKQSNTSRVAVNVSAMEALFLWHHAHVDALHEATLASRRWATTTRSPVQIYETTGSRMTAVARDGYIIDGGIPYPHNLLGIETTGNFVSLRQPLRQLVAWLFDPLSAYRIMDAAAVDTPPAAPVPTTALRRVAYCDEHGTVREITGARFHDGTHVRGIDLFRQST